MVADYDIINNDNSVDTIVECIGGYRPAYDYVKSALLAGKNVVTANKKMLAKYYSELSAIAKERNVQLRFAASVGGGIAWLEMLYAMKNQESIDSFKGIMNGTSNYILDSVFCSDTSFAEALKQAQIAGYAEADPSDDIDGVDTANKTCLSANVAYDGVFDIENMLIKGIRYLNDADIQYCKENNYRCALVGQSSNDGNKKAIAVYPRFVDSEDVLYSIKKNYNCFELNSYSMQHAAISGQGAGQLPTAKNVIADLLKIKQGVPFVIEGNGIGNDDEILMDRFYIRTEEIDIFKEIIDERISSNSFITKLVSVKDLRKLIEKSTDKELFIAGVK